MKKIILFFCLLTIGLIAKSQSKSAKITFEKESISIGKIKQSIPKAQVFTFTNTGNLPLIIKDVEATCGCTATDFSNKPVLPGKKSTITITYNAATTGPFHKVIKIISNAEKTSQEIILTGEVI